MRAAIFTLNDDGPRLSPALAREIGLSESILFLQIEFWTRTSTTEEHESYQWTYQSVRDIQRRFPFWGVATIQRTIEHLVKLELILVGNFNQRPADKTRWFALNFDGIRKLQSIQIGKEPFQNGTPRSKTEQEPFQNGTTLPESSLPESISEREHSDPKKKKSPEEIEKEREAKAKVFGRELAPYVEKYGKEMIRAFFEYWTEPYQHDRRYFRKEKQETWDTARRLATWARRDKDRRSRFNEPEDDPFSPEHIAFIERGGM